MASNLEPKINRIATAVTSALSALTAKGVTVPEGANVESLAALIESIEAGGGLKVSIGTYTSANNTAHITVQHMLGVIPTFAFVCVLYGGSKTGLLMLFQNELTTNISLSYGDYISASKPLTSAGLTEAKPYNTRVYGANESDISFGVNTTDYKLFLSGNTYQWIVGVTE